MVFLSLESFCGKSRLPKEQGMGVQECGQQEKCPTRTHTSVFSTLEMKFYPANLAS